MQSEATFPPAMVMAILLLMTAGTGLQAAEPATGTLSPASPEISFVSGPNAISNVSATVELICQAPVFPCDDFDLNVQLPADFASTQANAQIVITTAWEGADDYDIYLLDAAGSEVNRSAGSTNPEVMQLPAGQGSQRFTVRIVPFAVTGTLATTTIKLELPLAAGSDPATQVPAADGLAPRYQVHVSPPDLGNDAGEPTLGYNPLSKRVMFVSYVNALRVSFAENASPALPESCAARWENKSGLLTTLNSLDPIMTTDQDTGRTFNSQLSGANSLFEFSDDDGESWTPGQLGLPNGGADHQGVVAGPYPAGVIPGAGLLYPNAVYYCSQSVASAFCARSDDGGQTFGPGMPFKNTACSAGALHGHPKVAPDGTLYIPDSSQCVLGLGESAEKVVAFVSTDAGLSYEVRPIPQSQGGAGSDPSIGLASDGTAYMCYENADGRTHVAVSSDQGRTWSNDTDIGASQGLVATRFPAMIAGDPDRAACAFLGTKTQGPDLELSFTGVWYPYIATTYDRGETWHLLNLSPNDPVQGHGGIGTSGTNRNLLDFNDLELDDMGRPLFAYADGCVGGCVIDPSQNSFAAKGTIARQTGGRTLYSAFDGAPASRFNASTPLPPAAACPDLNSSQRSVSRTLIGWRAPDDGGARISNYRVYRASTANGPFQLIGESGEKTQFVDDSADPAVAEYFYKVVAINAQGESPDSNVLALPISEAVAVDTCALPGELIIQDPAGDAPIEDADILSLAVAEPDEYAGHLVLTVKLANFTANAPPPSSFYPILFPLYDNLYLALDASQVVPRLVYGRFIELPQGLLEFSETGELDARSSYGADGTVVMVVPKTLFGELQVGDVIAGFDVRSRVGAPSAPSRDTAGPADYIVRGHDSCAIQGLSALAELQADRERGSAPLSVTFTISGEATPGTELATYSLDFGDNEFVRDQPFGDQSSVQVVHTYRQAGTYWASASVRDGNGKTSTNLAQRTILVRAEDGVRAVNRSGGSLGWLGLLLILLLPFGRRPQALRRP